MTCQTTIVIKHKAHVCQRALDRHKLHMCAVERKNAAGRRYRVELWWK